jgi:tRNA (guanine37-N1)-methyltransferase
MTEAAQMTVRVLTLFPEIFPGALGHSLAGKALADGIWRLETVDIREFARDKHRSVDDTPFGGGAGMVMRPDVLAAAIDSVVPVGGGSSADRALICLSPRGAPLTQDRVRALSGTREMVLVCGRYEGIDQRLIEGRGLEEISLGDYVLSSGEPAALALIDACVRLLPGVVGDRDGLGEESFETGLLEYPQYTKPRVWEGREVPEVLLSGHHDRIRHWRRTAAERLTRARRPDLWRRYEARRGTAGGDA